MRVLHIGQHHELVGGAEVHREQVLSGLSARGHGNGFFGTSPTQSLRRPDRRVVRRPVYDPERLVSDWRLQRELRRYMHEFQPDLVHLHQVSGLPLELYTELASCGLPVVETVYDYGLLCPNSWAVHGDGQACHSTPGAECFRHACTRNYPFNPGSVLAASVRLKLAREVVDLAIAPTQHLCDRLRTAGLRELLTLPYYPAAQGSRQSLGSSNAADRQLVVLVVARLEREKGVAELIEAFALLLQRCPGAILEVIGAGPQQHQLEARIARLGLSGSVRFLGSLSLEAVRQRMLAARVLAIPSIWMEALPLVTFDANACALPIVAHAIGGLPEAVVEGQNGCLVPVGDVAAFAAALERVLSDELYWTRLSNGALARSMLFSEQLHLDGLEAAYARARTIAARRGPIRAQPLGEDERVLLDAVLSHCGAMEKELSSLQHGLAGRLANMQRQGRRISRKLAERWQRLVSARSAAEIQLVAPRPASELGTADSRASQQPESKPGKVGAQLPQLDRNQGSRRASG